MKLLYILISLAVACLFVANSVVAQEAENNAQVMQAFTSTEKQQSEHVTISDKEKQLVMFFLGVPLLVFILTAGVLGIAMGVYGKPVFVAHMIFAGLSITLAVAHAIVGLVWFYPF